jgi:hypothetical protein
VHAGEELERYIKKQMRKSGLLSGSLGSRPTAPKQKDYAEGLLLIEDYARSLTDRDLPLDIRVVIRQSVYPMSHL